MKRALLVIDMQNEYFSGKLPVTYPPESLENILKAMDLAQSSDVPTILIQHTTSQENGKTFVKGTEGWEIIPEVLTREYDYLMEKPLPGSFTDTNLETWLREKNINTVTISGYMTQMC